MALGWATWWLSLVWLCLCPSAAGVWLCLALAAYWRLERRPPLLAAGQGPWRSFLCARLPQLAAPLAPTPWLLDGRLHTAAASLLSQAAFSPMHFRRELLLLPDGGQVALDWLHADESGEKSKVIALVLPGLTGDSSAAYLRSSLKAAQKRGVTCVVFNNRGLGGIDLKTMRTFCACSWEDAREVACHVRRLHPECTLIGLGFSMGGMLLTHLAAAQEKEARPLLEAVVAVSMPWDAHCATRSLGQGVNRLFSFLLARGMRHILLRHRLLMQASPHFSLALRAKSIKQFDTAFTAPHFGFRDVDHYYDSASLVDKVHRICIPLLAINASDDPFLPGEGIPVEAARASPHVAIVVTPRGGHLGFLEGVFGQRQLVGRIWDSFLQAVLAEPRFLASLHKSGASCSS